LHGSEVTVGTMIILVLIDYLIFGRRIKMLTVVECIPFKTAREMTKLLRINKHKRPEVCGNVIMIISKVKEIC
jgi:hypothetical protein